MSTATALPTSDERAVTALVLDGDPDRGRALAAALAPRGFAVAAAADGATGLSLLLDRLLELDVLVVDASLPGRDARDFLRLIRTAGGERDLKVVVLARRVGTLARAAWRRMGADAVVDPMLGAALVARAVDAAI